MPQIVKSCENIWSLRNFLRIFAKSFKLKIVANLAKKNNMNEILVPYGVRREIMEGLGYSYPTIRNALLGKSQSNASKKIRQAAINKGGYEIVKK